MKNLNKENQKKMVSKILRELEPLLHRAIEEDRTTGLSAFEMIMVSTDMLDSIYKKNPPKKEESSNVVSLFKKK